MGWLRVLIKRMLCRWMLLTEFCEVCGRRQPVVWTAPNWLWIKVKGKACYATEAEALSGVMCPECFDKRATQLGLFLRWRPEVEEN